MDSTECEARVILGIYDLTDHPDAITAALGINPTKVTSGNDSSWSLEFESGDPDDLSELLNELLGILKPLDDKAKGIIKNNRTQISLVAYYFGSNMGANLSKEQLEEITKLGCDVDIDFYCLGEE